LIVFIDDCGNLNYIISPGTGIIALGALRKSTNGYAFAEFSDNQTDIAVLWAQPQTANDRSGHLHFFDINIHYYGGACGIADAICFSIKGPVTPIVIAENAFNSQSEIHTYAINTDTNGMIKN